MSSWMELERQRLMHTFKRTPVVLVRGEGCRVWDDDGRVYLDMVGGWAVDSLGHSSPVVAEAVSRQARVLVQTSNQFYTIPQLEVADLLVRHSCFDKVFFCNSGAEANEGAVKLARKFGKLHRNGAYVVITTDRSFHGRTLAMVAATGKPAYQKDFTPLPAGFVNVPFDDVDAIASATTDVTVAVMLEPIQGEGGVNVPRDSYLTEVRGWCDEKGLLLILDEIQTGVARAGTLWAYQQYGVEPDIMTLGKGLGGGVPIGAILAKEEVACFEPGDHGSTFGGNPLACSAGLAVMREVIQKDLASHVASVGEYLKQLLLELKAKHRFVADVRGRGLLLAMEFDREIAAEVLEVALGEGMLLNSVTLSAIRLIPPLVISRAEVEEAASTLDRVLSVVGARLGRPSPV